MTLAIALALLAQAAPSLDRSAIPAKDWSELDRCVPKRLGEASDCLRRALGEETAAEVNTPKGDAYGAAVAKVASDRFDLTNPHSPVARDMAGLRVYSPADAGYVLLADLQARVGRNQIDWAKYARERALRPTVTPAPVPLVAAAPAKPAPGPLPHDRCKRPEDAASLTIVSCELRADGTISRTASMGGPAAGLPAGAVAVELEKCQFGPPLPAGTRLKGCYKLADGRLLKQTARIVEAPKD